MLATLGIFFYVGVEVGLAQFMVGYFGLTDVGGFTAAVAAKFTFYYWFGALVGRLLGFVDADQGPGGQAAGDLWTLLL